MTDEERVKHVTEIMNLIEAYRRGQDVESWRAVMRKLFDVIGVKDETPPEPAGGVRENVHDIVARARLWLDSDNGRYDVGDWVFAYENLLEDIEALIQPPTAPQVHIPGLDQTMWDETAR